MGDEERQQAFQSGGYMERVVKVTKIKGGQTIDEIRLSAEEKHLAVLSSERQVHVLDCQRLVSLEESYV